MNREQAGKIVGDFEAKHGPLLEQVALAMAGMIENKQVADLLMFNRWLASLAEYAAEELRKRGKEQPAKPGAGARLIPGAKRYFFDN